MIKVMGTLELSSGSFDRGKVYWIPEVSSAARLVCYWRNQRYVWKGAGVRALMIQIERDGKPGRLYRCVV